MSIDRRTFLATLVAAATAPRASAAAVPHVEWILFRFVHWIGGGWALATTVGGASVRVRFLGGVRQVAGCWGTARMARVGYVVASCEVPT